MSILVFTVIAIVATVNSAEQPAPIPPTDGEEVAPPVSEPEQEQGQAGSDTPAPPLSDDTLTDTEPKEEPIVYGIPCSGYVQKEYSSDTLVFSQTMNDHRVHLGVDIAGKVGDPVKSFGKGRVERVYSDPFMGRSIVIDHGNGIKSVYMNLADEVADGIKEGVAIPFLSFIEPIFA